MAHWHKKWRTKKWKWRQMVRNLVPIQCYMIFLPYDLDVMWIHNFFFFAPLAIALSCPAPSFYPCANSAGARTPNLDTQKYLRFGLIEYCVTVCLNVDLLFLKYCVIVSLNTGYCLFKRCGTMPLQYMLWYCLFILRYYLLNYCGTVSWNIALLSL